MSERRPSRFARPDSNPSSRARLGEGAILVGLALKRAPGRGTAGDPEDSLDELATLARSAGARVIASTLQTRDAAEPATLIGAGKVRELAGQAKECGADLVLFDRDLSPTQLRNLEDALPCKVLDRTQLILDIFASRARTREGQLQVELAQLNYLLPRLTGRGAAMSRLGGGIGTRGPGETKLETDRRRIGVRIARIRKQLEAVRSHRSVQRRQRQAVPLATISLAGYTNAGKSTLFNQLTRAGVAADARMFATLDPTVRQIVLPSRRRVLVSDTVGFIRNLPSTLIKAFLATLEEVAESTLILHLVDASSPAAVEQTRQVLGVLGEIGAAQTPRLMVLTKIDLLDPETGTISLGRRILADCGETASPAPPVVAISAMTGAGLESLRAAIDQALPLDRLCAATFRFPPAEAGRVHLLHEHARVLSERWRKDGCWVEAEVPESVITRLRSFLLRSR